MENNYRVSVDNTTVKVEMSTNEFFNLIKSVERAKTSLMRDRQENNNLLNLDNEVINKYMNERDEIFSTHIERLEQLLKLSHLI